MYVVAHPDDSLLFQSPDLLQNVQSGLDAMTVHLTSGDNGQGQGYWERPRVGHRGGVRPNGRGSQQLDDFDVKVGSHSLMLRTLTAQPNISVVYMRLPDGGSLW